MYTAEHMQQIAVFIPPHAIRIVALLLDFAHDGGRYVQLLALTMTCSLQVPRFMLLFMELRRYLP